MADDLVVREIAEDLQNYGLYSHDDELKVIARAYLERDAQLAAMTAERDSLTKINAGLCKDFNTLLINGARLEDKLTASEAEREPTFEQWQRISKAHDDHWCPATWRAMLDAALADPGKAGDTVHNDKP